MFEELLRQWDGEEVVVRHDRETGTWIFVCVHSTTLGPAMGGTRMKEYAAPAEALEDGLRLASGMTRKLAVAGLPCGGGKAVLAVPRVFEGDERRLLFERYGDLIAALGGTYVTGPDVNTGEADMDTIGSRTPHVFCRSAANGGSGDPSIHTALGTFHGIRAALAHALGSGDVSGRTILVQGTGSVGGKLARLLLDAGAVVLVSDVDEERARSTGAETVPPDEALELECDVYAPCALGATLNEETIPGLRCRVVAGAANNQLATPEDGERLRARGILYAPDFVINAGGAMHGIGLEQLGWDEVELERRVEGIGETLTRIFEWAEREGITTDEAAERLAAERLGRPATGNRP
ncbi:MAG TPA: Glu/Leu/Phe/Val dehydrogenase dimerization domain-containing protein [Gaiellaceae bacterium]|nr:Glu/Leu/Phe/Val dehydrogenase dimerization domain-containing protein [Gaiellaceae bacterium]